MRSKIIYIFLIMFASVTYIKVYGDEPKLTIKEIKEIDMEVDQLIIIVEEMEDEEEVQEQNNKRPSK